MGPSEPVGSSPIVTASCHLSLHYFQNIPGSETRCVTVSHWDVLTFRISLLLWEFQLSKPRAGGWGEGSVGEILPVKV